MSEESDSNATGLDHGRVIDERYVIDREIGYGAMGRVYVAVDQRLRRKVAIKMMRTAA